MKDITEQDVRLLVEQLNPQSNVVIIDSDQTLVLEDKLYISADNLKAVFDRIGKPVSFHGESAAHPC
jgi:hypothetical protein